MQVIYRAENLIDAQQIKDLLEGNGIVAHVNGQYLQGGIGELPLMGLTCISVEDEDYKQAVNLIKDYQQAQPEIPAEDLTDEVSVLETPLQEPKTVAAMATSLMWITLTVTAMLLIYLLVTIK